MHFAGIGAERWPTHDIYLYGDAKMWRTVEPRWPLSGWRLGVRPTYHTIPYSFIRSSQTFRSASRGATNVSYHPVQFYHQAQPFSYMPTRYYLNSGKAGRIFGHAPMSASCAFACCRACAAVPRATRALCIMLAWSAVRIMPACTCGAAVLCCATDE